MPITHPQDHHPLPIQSSLQADLALKIKNLSFTYPDGREALKHISLTIKPGERVALVGPNGAGKSTLLLHLNGILQGKGDIWVGGLAVEKENLPIIRAMVGLVFQNPDDQLFSPTVFEDVAFGPLHMGLDEKEVRQRVAEALAQVGMASYSDRLSYHLSMGEKKRIAIATVLSMHPQILALDEPSAGLDPRARRQLIHLLKTLPQTQIIATHDMMLVHEMCSRMVLMDEGRIIADGATVTLFEQAELLEAHGLERPDC